MANNNISVIIRAEDQASGVLKTVDANLGRVGDSGDRQSTLVQRLSANWSTFAGISAASGVALYGLWGQVERANEAAMRLQSSLIGLNSIAEAFGQDATAAKKAAQELANDGLMTVADAATGLKNLLAAGFSLDQATQLMVRFKDSAAFGRQSALSFGQAVSSATEGIKNGNSILVDNAGVTKNLSVILTEAGFSANDLQRATTDANVRMALFNGILKETNPQVGDAAKLAESAAGKQAMLAAETEKAYQQIGLALQPALLAFLQAVTPIIVAVSDWVSKNPELTAGIVIVTGSLLVMSTAVGTVATAITAAGVVAATFGPTVSASVAIASGAFTAFKAVLLSPIVLPALGIAAMIGSLVAVQQEGQRTLAVLDELADAQRIEREATADAHKQLLNLRNNGTPEQKARAIQKGRQLGLPGFADGVRNFAGGLAVVGERGPEIISLPRGANVYSNPESREMVGNTVVNITGQITINSPGAATAFWDRIDKTQRLAKLGMAGAA